MDDLPPEPQNLRFLRLLVTALTATMILGITTIVVLLFIRFNQEPPAPAAPVLPQSVSLPAGQTAKAVTDGGAWFAIVTDAQTILIFDKASGELRQTVQINID